MSILLFLLDLLSSLGPGPLLRLCVCPLEVPSIISYYHHIIPQQHHKQHILYTSSITGNIVTTVEAQFTKYKFKRPCILSSSSDSERILSSPSPKTWARKKIESSILEKLNGNKLSNKDYHFWAPGSLLVALNSFWPLIFIEIWNIFIARYFIWPAVIKPCVLTSY